MTTKSNVSEGCHESRVAFLSSGLLEFLGTHRRRRRPPIGDILVGLLTILKKNNLGILVYALAAVFYGLMVWQLALAAQESENVIDNPPTGFFTKLALAHGYQAVKDVFQTDRYKPEKPTSTFKADVEGIFLIFDLLPRENPAHIIGQLYLDKGDGRQSEKLLEAEEVYLTTSQDSGFLEFGRPPDGWIPGDYKLKLHLGEKVTAASQIGTLRFKVVPAS